MDTVDLGRHGVISLAALSAVQESHRRISKKPLTDR